MLTAPEFQLVSGRKMIENEKLEDYGWKKKQRLFFTPRENTIMYKETYSNDKFVFGKVYFFVVERLNAEKWESGRPWYCWMTVK